MEEETKKQQQPSELDLLDLEISELEKSMESVKAQYDVLRKSLSSGCVSGGCVGLSRKLEELTHQMETLKEMRERAITKIDDELCKTTIVKQIEKPEQIGFCKGGCTDMVVDNRHSTVVCQKCGYILRFDITASCANGSYKSMPQRKRNGGYRPPVHFLEVTTNLMAARPSSAEDFDFVLEKLEKMCDKANIPREKRTKDILRRFLKQLDAQEKDIIRVRTRTRMSDAQAVKEYVKKQAHMGRFIRYTDYYKQCPEFSKRLSRIAPPIMTGTQLDRIIAVFPLCVLAYKTSPRYLRKLANREGRKKKVPNNQSCNYLLYKICQLLGYVEFLPYIPLPKSLENIDDNDINGWKHICTTYGWTYIPTR